MPLGFGLGELVLILIVFGVVAAVVFLGVCLLLTASGVAADHGLHHTAGVCVSPHATVKERIP